MRRSTLAKVLDLEKTMVARRVVANTGARTVASRKVASRTVGSLVAKVLEKMARDQLDSKAKAKAPPKAAGHAEAHTFLTSVPRTVEIKASKRVVLDRCADCRPRQWTVIYSVCFGGLVQNMLQTFQELYLEKNHFILLSRRSRRSL